jgi:Uroporphyrinogen-III synthase HemD
VRARVFCHPPHHRVQRTRQSRPRSLQPSFVHSEPGGAARAGRARRARQHARRHGSRFIAGAIAVDLAGRRPELVLEAAPLRSGPPIRSGNPGGSARVDPAVQHLVAFPQLLPLEFLEPAPRRHGHQLLITLPVWSANMEVRHFRRPHWPKSRMWILHTSIELIHDWNSAPPNIFIFQTGVGTRALFAPTDLLGQTDLLLQLLDSAQVVVRGPKPATVLHSRKVRIDCAASDPFTTHEVLAAMHGTPLRGKRVVVQRYGETKSRLTGRA